MCRSGLPSVFREPDLNDHSTFGQRTEWSPTFGDRRSTFAATGQEREGPPLPHSPTPPLPHSPTLALALAPELYYGVIRRHLP